MELVSVDTYLAFTTLAYSRLLELIER
jgi:hypothetical protein